MRRHDYRPKLRRRSSKIFVARSSRVQDPVRHQLIADVSDLLLFYGRAAFDRNRGAPNGQVREVGTQQCAIRDAAPREGDAQEWLAMNATPWLVAKALRLIYLLRVLIVTSSPNSRRPALG
jgi:hypothetical protein